MSIQLAVISTTTGSESVNIDTLLSGSGSAAMTLKLLVDSDPTAIPTDVATVHLSSANPSTTPGFFLTPHAPTLEIECDPADLWVSVYGDDHFVQIIATRQ